MEAVATEPRTIPTLSWKPKAAMKVRRGKIDLAEVAKVNGFTPRIQRIKKVYLDATPAVDGQRAKYMLESYLQSEGEHPAVRRGKAFANVLENCKIVLREDELLLGGSTSHVRGAHPWVEGLPRNLLPLLKRSALTAGSAVVEATISDEDRNILIAACEYWMPRRPSLRSEQCQKEFAGENTFQWLSEARMHLSSSPSMMLVAPGCDYEKILKIGYNGFIQQAQDHIDRIMVKAGNGDLSAEDHEKVEWLKSVIISLQGMITFARRHAELAREAARTERNPKRRQELLKCAEVCEWVPANPPRTFQEALQAFWFTVIGHDIQKAAPNNFAGRFDQYMWPFYSKDINEGRITRQEAAELLGCMFMKWVSLEPFMFIGLIGKRDHQEISPSNYYVNVTIGGVMPHDGSDASNELSCMVLQVARQVKTHQPHISLRFHRNMAPELLDIAIECNRDHGAGIPAWFNDRLGIDYCLDRGVKWEDARDWAVCGCINTTYPKSFAWSRGYVVTFCNHAKLVELALNNGVDPHTGRKIGIETGDPRNFKTFDELVDAYRKQMDALYDFMVQSYMSVEKVRREDAFYFPFISAFLEDCIAKGKDCTRGGERYPGLEGAVFVDRGLQDASDSMLAIKKVVFDDKLITMEQMLDALKNNFVGYDQLRAACLVAPKYGNDTDEGDALMVSNWKYSIDKAQSYRDETGRRFTMFRQGAAWCAWAGAVTGTLANGRLCGMPLADASASPVQGADVSGPTATMNSVAKLDNAYLEGPLLNMKFTPGMLKDKGGREKFANLLHTYMDKGGFHVQFNILDRQMLQDARKHPENYRDLVVRVAGYSAFWVELSPIIQDEIISRTEQNL